MAANPGLTATQVQNIVNTAGSIGRAIDDWLVPPLYGAENVGAIQTADGETAWTVSAGMDVEQARLILDADGEAYLCGTSRSDGQSAAAVIRMDLEAEDK